MGTGLPFDDVLVAAQAGAPWAFEVLYRDLAPAVTGYLRLHGAAEPDDLASETFLGVFTGLAGFRGDEAGLRAWVSTIAHRRLLDDWRRRSRRPPIADEPGDPAERPGGDAGGDAPLRPRAAAGPRAADRRRAGEPGRAARRRRRGRRAHPPRRRGGAAALRDAAHRPALRAAAADPRRPHGRAGGGGARQERPLGQGAAAARPAHAARAARAPALRRARAPLPDRAAMTEAR